MMKNTRVSICAAKEERSAVRALLRFLTPAGTRTVLKALACPILAAVMGLSGTVHADDSSSSTGGMPYYGTKFNFITTPNFNISTDAFTNWLGDQVAEDIEEKFKDKFKGNTTQTGGGGL